MPTIEMNIADLDRSVGRSLSRDELESRLPLAKAELKDYDVATGTVRIELNDTNRPDLWSMEGLARQFRVFESGHRSHYDFFDAPTEGREIIVDPAIADIRPHIGGFAAIGEPLSEWMLLQLIQTQEKLAENYGRKRLTLSIGIYELSQIEFPLHYKAVDPLTTCFVPLGSNQSMNLLRILEEHPKGKEYHSVLEGKKLFPYLVDANDGVLSFPPIINSRRSGEIKIGEQRLFVEATGTDQDAILLALNIFSCNLADRGFSILPVSVEYPFDTPRGRHVVMPGRLNRRTLVSVTSLNHALGSTFHADDIVLQLERYDVTATIEGDTIAVCLPDYRADYLHPVDVIEDFAISVGYNSFEPLMPDEFTVGRLSPIESLSDKVRGLMVGYGFEEIISNILISKQELTTMMTLPEDGIIEVANPMSLQHGSLRDSILPSLLRVETSSSKSSYPHRIFEVGEIIYPAENQTLGTQTEVHCAALIAHPTSTFSEIDSYLTILLHHLGLQFLKQPVDMSIYIPGRVGSILIGQSIVGSIGELTPELLDRWHIGVPISAFQLNLSSLLKFRGGQ